MGGKGFGTIFQDPYSLNTFINNNKKHSSKKLMNVVANEMCSNLIHDPFSLSLFAHRLSTMATFALEFELEILSDFVDLDEAGFLKATMELDKLSHAHQDLDEEEQEKRAN